MSSQISTYSRFFEPQNGSNGRGLRSLFFLRHDAILELWLRLPPRCTYRLPYWLCCPSLPSFFRARSRLTDRRLESEFNRHKEGFARLAALSDSLNPDCLAPGDPDICVLRGSDAILADLRRQTGFRELDAYVRKRPPYALWMPVQMTGTLSTSSQVYGYVYSRVNMTPRVGSVWQDLEHRQGYKQIADRWYLFSLN
jgi:hypothetical protein